MMKLNKETIRDPEVINIEGATMLLPEGWKREGGFVWIPEFSTQANLLMRVSDPHTGAAGQSLPAQHFVWTPPSSFSSMQPGSNYLGSVVLPPPRHPAECVQMALMPGPLQHLSGAQFMWAADLQGYTAELSRSVLHMTVHATRLRYAFGWGGRGWEEDVYLTIAFSPPDGWAARWWCSAWSLRAPMGELDQMTPLLAAVMLSVRNTFDWSAMLDYSQIEYHLNIQRQQTGITPQQPVLTAAQAKLFQQQRRGMIWANTQTPGSVWTQRKDEIRTKHRPTWDARQPASERERIALSQIIGGIETYINPFDSSRVQLPTGYAAYWVSKEGQVIISGDAAFDPRADSTAEWRKMNRYMPEPQRGWQP
jgi:hypothetical protein